jgi:small GTP-binding protein
MGASFSSLISAMFMKKNVRVVMVGLDAAGKTTILYKLRLNEVVTTIPTIGFNVETLEYKSLKMTVWDVGGQDKLRGLWHHYFANCNAVIYVVDSADVERLPKAAEELHKILDHDDLRTAPVLIYANKQDVRGARTPAEIATAMGLHKLMKRQWHVQPTVGVTGQGLYEGLDKLVAFMK